MKRFQFSLERVLKYRRSQADLEQARLAALEAELTKIHEQIQSLANSFKHAVSTVAPHPADRAELGRYRMIIESQTAKLQHNLIAKQSQIDTQRAAYLKAKQAAEVLDKVKARQYDAWQRDLQKELDSLAMDSYLARWKQ